MLDKKLSYNLEKIVHNSKSKSVLLAISGGIDSTFLMHILLIYEIKPILFFVNYNSTTNSKKREEFIQSLSLKYNLKFISKDISLTSRNFESNARDIRYKLLNEYADKNNINLILTAHHKDDQLETLYMKYEDKADWVSFLGIRFQYNKVFRPILHMDKTAIIKFVEENNIKWIEDSSNEDLSIRRNNIRLKVLPLIKKNNPILIEKIYSKFEASNEKMVSFNKLLTAYTADYVKYIHKDYFIVLNNFIEKNNTAYSKLFYQHLFNKYINLQVQCSGKHWEAFFKFIKDARVGSFFLVNSSISIIRDREFHYVYRNQFLESCTKKVDNEVNDWYNTKFIVNDENNENYNYIESVSFPKSIFSLGLKIRNWTYGDKFYNNQSSSYKSLKKVFINKKISVFDKAIYPIILDSNDEIIYIPRIYQRYGFDCKNDNLVTLSWVN